VLNSNPEHIIRLEDLEDYLKPKEILLNSSEQELVLACAKGKRAAQKRVYELFAGKMLNVCRRYAKDKDHAQDLMHDGFIKVFLNIQNFKGQASLQTWITRIMINNSISAIRKEVRNGIKVKLEDVQIAEPEIVYFELEDKQSLSAADVFKQINELPLGYKTVFSMYVLDGYTHREIAAELEITEGTSKSQLAKAKKMLARKLREAQ